MTERLRRPPAIPLVTHDPYLSAWCMADRLTDDWSRHWTGNKMALYVVARIDGVPWRLVGGPQWLARAAEQIELTVTATRTVARMRADDVELEVEFLSPLLVDDLDLMSRPVTYVTVRARSLDARTRQVELYVDMTGEWCVNLPHERVFWARHERDGLVAMSFRHEIQPVLEKAGDHRRIDWGTLFLAGPAVATEAIAGDIDICRDVFLSTGKLTDHGLSPPPRKTDYNRDAIIATVQRFACRPEPGGCATVMIGYDDEFAIEFFGTKLRAWWRRDGLDGMGVLARAWAERESVAARAAAFDASLAARATALAGAPYADLCALAWRHTIAAHKLCAGPDGQPLLFSKENFSNGCIATMDVTYPSAPLFLAYNPALVRAMIDPYFAYCTGPDWPFPFCAHDLGTYPKANGQTYRNFDKDKTLPIIETQMPVEECGNMLILVGALAVAEQDGGAYAKRHWKTLCRWADYLIETGADPMAQLCTDDFSGVLASNVNLSGKATVGLGCAAMLARMIGDGAAEKKYRAAAEAFAKHLLDGAREGDATRLAYDQPGTWSLKYNLVWDRLLGLGLFPEAEMRREHAYYRTQLRPYGVPLDNRSTLTKPEWALWAASLADDPPFFADMVERIVRYANHTQNRVPLSDLYLTDTGRKIGFQARSVLGGLFIAFLEKR